MYKGSKLFVELEVGDRIFVRCGNNERLAKVTCKNDYVTEVKSYIKSSDTWTKNPKVITEYDYLREWGKA
jgi:hypothetical protein